MIETKKRILIGILICAILGACGILYYFMQNNEGEYFKLEEDFFKENEETNNNVVNIENTVLENKKQIIVHIAGQIVNPGVISLNEGARIIDAINAAGGSTKEADLSKVNLAYILEDAQRIYIPSINEKEDNDNMTDGSIQSTIVTSESNTGEKTTTETLKININIASETDLQKIPGIGKTIASKIIEYRKENGKFNSIEEIKKVSGIGESKYNNIKKYICVK